MAETAELANFLRAQAQVLDVRLEPAGARYSSLSTVLRHAAPAVVRLELNGDERFVLLVGGRGRCSEVLGRDLGRRRRPLRDV